MNAYVKTLQTRVLFPVRILPISLTKMQMLVFGLALALLLSAFGLVYVKDMNRRLMSQTQQLQSSYIKLHTQWSQLMIEQGSLSSQARVQEIASQDLHMVMPQAKAIVMIKP